MKIKYHGNYEEESVKKLVQDGLLILPTIAYANLDQMFIDVLLYNAYRKNKLEKVATFHTFNIIPFLGSFPFTVNHDSNFSCTTALELFHIIDSNILVIQQRSQPIDGLSEYFKEEMMSFVSYLSPKTVAFISSTDCTYVDMNIQKNTVVYYTRSKEVLSQVGESLPSMNLAEEEIFGSGLLMSYQKYCSAHSIEYSSYAAFVNEGGNFRDAFNYFIKVNSVCKWLEMDDLKMPPIWYELDPWLDEDILFCVCC